MANEATDSGTYRASANKVRISPRKVRLVVDQIRGQNVARALGILEGTAKRSAPIVRTLLKSAIANAEQQNADVDVDALKVQAVFVDKGQTLKRFRPRAMGRATPIRKRSSKITVIVG
ncbi:MAG: 50S ribosomal protein L22 [Candidatus Lambdaproteobacteria bacterium]|nr:50S ribosomal protein L22 [Candidatus Lambdaproteobacteria bacterium]